MYGVGVEEESIMVATTTRSAFDRQLNALQHDVLTLAEMVESQLVGAMKALRHQDSELAERVVRFDNEINKRRYEVEENAYLLLALQSPMASDMRRIVATVSVVTNLERMGDHAAGIAKLVIRMANAGCLISCATFDEMERLAIISLRDGMKALETQDTTLAKAVFSRDDEIDALHKTAYDQMVKSMTENPATIECATMLLWVSHNLERFADRICNICDRILYLVTGDLHQPRIDPMP
jgi:phosphate transport system protein